MRGLATLRMLAVMALRSLWSHRLKSVIVGALLFFGALLVVVGTAILDSVERSMAESVVSSLSGHLQVYSEDAEDDLALFGSGFMGTGDFGEIEDFAPVREAIGGLDAVEAILPMGLGMATYTEPGELDEVLTELRDAHRAGDADRVRDLAEQVRRLAGKLREQFERREAISADQTDIEEAKELLDRVRGEAFWEELDRDPQQNLQFLDSEIAPLAGGQRLVYLRYVGTDLPRFAEHFDRFELVEGKRVPAGHRGILLSERFRERVLKHKIARMLDAIHRGLEQGERLGEGGELHAKADRLPDQYQRITMQLDAEEAEALTGELRELLPEVEGELPALLQAFLEVGPENFRRRYDQFYDLIAPRIELHPVHVGDVMTLRSVARGGYVKSINVKVWGIFHFEGLEGSELAGAQNLVDMVTFRELYGRMSQATRDELEQLREEVHREAGVKDVTREDAEEKLFGGGGGGEATPSPEEGSADGADADEDAADDADLNELELARKVEEMKESKGATFDPEAVDEGLAISAAVLLSSASGEGSSLGAPDPGRIAEVRRAIERLSDERDLGLQAVDWQDAAGLVGQFIVVIRVVLYVALAIVFVVTLIIINNAMVIATMDRVAEIGTLRAIGAQRSAVVTMVLLETLTLGLLAGGAGAAAGAGVVATLGRVGIPSSGVDILVFLFSGPRLHPTVGAEHVAIALAVILVVSLVSSLQPARIATRVQPVEAMQARE